MGIVDYCGVYAQSLPPALVLEFEVKFLEVNVNSFLLFSFLEVLKYKLNHASPQFHNYPTI
jgi:hypothetical protein